MLGTFLALLTPLVILQLALFLRHLGSSCTSRPSRLPLSADVSVERPGVVTPSVTVRPRPPQNV
jgi:hypothetical protein